MGRDQRRSAFLAIALAFCISFGGVMAIDTGFYMEGTHRAAVALFCAVYSALTVWAFSGRRGDWILLGGTVLTGLLLWARRVEITDFYGTYTSWEPGPLQEQVTDLVRYIFSFYHKAYGWGSAPTGVSSSNPMELGLCLVAVPVIWAVCRAVCCRKWAMSAVIVGFLPVMACLVVTDTVPATWALMLLLPAMLILVLTQTVRRISVRDANRLTAMLLIPVILASSLLFWAVPREEYVPKHEELFQWFEALIGKESGEGTGGNGTLPGINGPSGSLQVDLAGLGPEITPKTPVMDVTADRSGTLYLRGRAYESYDGKSWSQSDFGSQPDGLWPQRGDAVGSVEITTRRIHPVLYFPYYADGELWTNRMTNGAIPNGQGLTSYSFQQYDAGESILELWSDGGRLQACTQLPEETLAEAIRILEENGMYGDSLNETASIIPANIASLVKQSARYDRRSQRMPEEEADFAIWFLENADRGYCVHFATAATVLLRAAGIPARYVTGYAVDVKAGETVTVTADKAHAWVEYFDAQTGWCVLEATPAEEEEIPTEPTESTGPEETTQPTQPPETTEPDETAQPTQPSGTQPAGTTGPGQSEKPRLNLRWLGRLMQVVAWVAGIVIVLWGQYFLRRRRKEQRMYTGETNSRALACWREVCLEARLRKLEPPEHLRSLAEKAKYSHHTLSNQELHEFTSWLRNAKRSRKQLQKWYTRLLQKLIWAVK